MSCGIRRIVNGCAAHQVVACRDVSEPRTHPPSPKFPSKGSARGMHLEYPVTVRPLKNGTVMAKFVDVPEALTCGRDETEALR
jgi:hypothetical protein